jgi:arylsulfatase A-like enzyme
MQILRCAQLIGALAVMLSVGCSRQAPRAGEVQADDAAARQHRVQEEEPAPPVDLRLGDNLAEQDRVEADDAVPEPQNPLIRGIKKLFEATPLADEGELSELEDSLLEADTELSRIRTENREAIRQMNRQVPIRGARSPNIVLIVADDLGHGDLGCYGQQRIKTPRIDRMAAEGMRFNDYYAGSPDGTVSRLCLLTGRHAGRAGRRTVGKLALTPEDRTLAEVLWQAGYATGLVGLWGIPTAEGSKAPTAHGYDEWFGCLTEADGAWAYPPTLWSNRTRVNFRANADGAAGVHAYDLYTQEATSFLRRQRRQRPFFLQLCYTKLDLPGTSTADGPYTAEEWTPAQKDYATMVTRLDRSVGQVLDELARLGLEGNTAVLLTSDNGPRADDEVSQFFESFGPLRAATGELYEGGIRVPLIVRWPATVPAGTTTQHVSGCWDLMPTMAAMVRAIRVPQRIDGVSLLSVLRGQPGGERELVYWEIREGDVALAQAVRLGDWKGVRRSGANVIELYDLSADAGETTDVAGDHPEIIGRIQRKPASPGGNSAR